MTVRAHKRPEVEYQENKGQWDPAVRFRAGLGTGTVFLENNRLAFSFFSPADLDEAHAYSMLPKLSAEEPTIRGHAWFLNFIGSSAQSVTGMQQQTHFYNYFIGNDPQHWASQVGAFASVEYQELYPGIDMLVHQGSGHFKYDFHVAPGVSPAAIQLELEGLESIEVRDGQLIMQTSVGEFIENKPYSFQIINGVIIEVDCRYVLDGNRVTFGFPNGYDSAHELIIDPELIASTLSGAVVSAIYGHVATYDSGGNVYTGGMVLSAGYPATPGAFSEVYSGLSDIGLSKLDPEGTTLLWATLVGGSLMEYPNSMLTNDQADLFVYGVSRSVNFPTTSGAFDTSHNGLFDIIMFRLSADGAQLIGSTYVGGSEHDGMSVAAFNFFDENRSEIIFGTDGNISVASCSSSPDFPITSGAYQGSIAGSQDAVYFSLNAALTELLNATFIGSSGEDAGFSLRMNSAGQVYIVGIAGAPDFPTTSGAFQTDYLGGNSGWGEEMDGFIIRMNGSGTILEHGTFYGTVERDQCFLIDLDNEENVFVFGQGGYFPVVGSVYSDPGSKQFITKFSGDLSSVMLSTVVGAGGVGYGGIDFVPVSFMVDYCNMVYIAAHTFNEGFPITSDALHSEGGIYLAVYSQNLAQLEYATMYTGDHVHGCRSSFDKSGIIYQAVCIDAGFAATPDAWSTEQVGDWDIGVFKIRMNANTVTSALIASGSGGCAPYDVQFQNVSVGTQFIWDFGDGTTSSDFEPEHTYADPGSYTVRLVVSDSLSCNVSDTSYFSISVVPPINLLPAFDYEMDCSAILTANLTGNEALSYSWDLGDGTVIEGENAVHIYQASGDYVVTLTAAESFCGTEESISQTITVLNGVSAVLSSGNLEGCVPFLALFTADIPGAQYTWNFGDGSEPQSGNEVSHTYTEPGEYILTLSAEGIGNCSGTDESTFEVLVIDPPIIEASFEAMQIDECESLTLQGSNLSVGDDLTYLWDFGDGNTSTETDVNHTYNAPGEYVVTLTAQDQVCGNLDVATASITLIDQMNLSLPLVAVICHNEEAVELAALDPGPNTSYLWSTGETTSAILASDSGVYSVTAIFNNCAYSQLVEVVFGQEILLLDTVDFCQGSSQYLEVPYTGSSWYSWCTGELGQRIVVEIGGEYCFQFLDADGCLQHGEITAYTQSDALIYLPSAFTPNNDGINDVFKPEGTGIEDFELTIWSNRGGEIIFRSSFFDKPWDGTFLENDEEVPNGVYPYLVSYRGECNPEKVEEVGFIVVVR
ncbi:MAG: PKD domain-containing protein [Flavobacteriales bacterium]